MPVSVHNHQCVSASKTVAAPVSNCTILQVAVLKQAMMMKTDKLRGECENSKLIEEIAVCKKEIEQLKEQLRSRDKEWQARLKTETAKWQAMLEAHQQDVETERGQEEKAVAGKICLCFWEREKNKFQFTE